MTNEQRLLADLEGQFPDTERFLTALRAWFREGHNELVYGAKGLDERQFNGDGEYE